MTLGRARIVRFEETEAPTRRPVIASPRVVRKEEMEARERAAAIVEAAHAEARAIVHRAQQEARGSEALAMAAHATAWEEKHARLVLTARDKIAKAAAALAERLVGAALDGEPERVLVLLDDVMHTVRAAEHVTIEAHPADVAVIRDTLKHVTVSPNAALSRGSLIVTTELGSVDARLETRIEQLLPIVRDAL